MELYNSLIGIFWLVFVVFWIVSAFSAKRTIRRNWGFLWLRLVFIIVILSFFRFELFQGLGGYQVLISTNPWEGLVGVVLCALGIALAIWARVYLGRNWGIPMSLKEHPELVTTGPYAYIRHPIYTGVLLAMLGSSLASGLWWLAILVVSAAYFVYSATTEEGIMTKEFPNDYPAYKRRTKMLIPFVF
jgi:protein-S-isoprenylcysteine O-methyltransferase Ste14